MCVCVHEGGLLACVGIEEGCLGDWGGSCMGGLEEDHLIRAPSPPCFRTSYNNFRGHVSRRTRME